MNDPNIISLTGKGCPTACHDCGIPYEEMEDFLIPTEYWVQISPYKNEGGILCANCIVKRLRKIGLSQVPGGFVSGPIKSVSEETLSSIMELETIKKQFRLLFEQNKLKGALFYSMSEEDIEDELK